jgi:hypothetical protein
LRKAGAVRALKEKAAWPLKGRKRLSAEEEKAGKKACRGGP